MGKKRAPRVMKAQEVLALLQGQTSAETGEELLSAWVRLSTERVLQDALEREHAEVLKRGRYERHERAAGYRNGYAPGTRKTAEGVLRVKVPQVRGVEEPQRPSLWTTLVPTSDCLSPLMVERCARGMSQRDIALG
jgi:hypothetical protein